MFCLPACLPTLRTVGGRGSDRPPWPRPRRRRHAPQRNSDSPPSPWMGWTDARLSARFFPSSNHDTRWISRCCLVRACHLSRYGKKKKKGRRLLCLDSPKLRASTLAIQMSSK